MSNFTPEGFAAHILRTFTPRLPRGYAPRATPDTDSKGREMVDVTLPNPQEPRHSIALSAACRNGMVTTCTLWFGGVEVTAALDPADAVAAIEEIISGNLVAIVRYRDRSAYDDRRKATSGSSQWLYQRPDDEAALAAMMERLRSPAGFLDRLTSPGRGVFEVYDWNEQEILAR